MQKPSPSSYKCFFQQRFSQAVGFWYVPFVKVWVKKLCHLSLRWSVAVLPRPSWKTSFDRGRKMSKLVYNSLGGLFLSKLKDHSEILMKSAKCLHWQSSNWSQENRMLSFSITTTTKRNSKSLFPQPVCYCLIYPLIYWSSDPACKCSIHPCVHMHNPIPHKIWKEFFHESLIKLPHQSQLADQRKPAWKAWMRSGDEGALQGVSKGGFVFFPPDLEAFKMFLEPLQII